MWKIVTRGIRETFERRACRTNVYSQPSQDNVKNDVKTNLTCQQKKFFAPACITWNKGFCASAKSAGAKDKEHNYKWDTKHSWPEAIGWTSVLAAGWAVCQSLCLQKRIFDADSTDKKKKMFDYTRVNYLLTHIKSLQVKLKIANVLPVTNCVGNNSNLQDTDSQWHEKRPFGPITIEEAFNEAADEFKNTHKIVVGEFELCYGIKALEEKRYKDAWTHFSRGAKLSSPGSMFNLGLCYELGVGTLADAEKAAKHYNDAAAHDHADALYNLGIYHAQGKGGLPINISTARTCFTRAAKLGQLQAQRALELEKADIQSKGSNSASTVPKILPTSTSLPAQETNELNHIRGKLIDTMTSFITKSAGDAPGYSDGIARDSARVLMYTIDLLGLKNPDQAAVATATDNCVPC